MDWIEEGWNYILYNFIYRLFYYLEIAICMALDWIQELMDVFTGTTKVIYKTNFGSPENYLINIFFKNGAVSGVYLGMAAIGIVMAFVFALISVIRKSFDSNEKVKMSYGQILTNLFKSILLIICLNAGMNVIITATNVLMQSVVFIFDHAEDLSNGNDHIDFTDEEYAAMARILNTIGNYSLNPSYKNRYNINACYNEIRGDIGYLADQGVFKFYYETKDENNNIIPTWQSIIQEIANAANYNKEVPVDVYNEGIANSIYSAMEIIRQNSSIPVLQSYDRIEDYSGDKVNMGRVMFLIGTMGNGITGAAKNDTYNEHPSLTDPVRAPYYRGSKNVYDIDQVNKDFDIALHKTNYIVVYIAGGVLALNMALIIVTCVARIFNLLFLYVIAPPVFAVLPLDDGGKVKQWTTAFIVQSFSVFATVISMRIYLLFLPIILDPGLQISQNIIIDMVGRVVLIYAGIEAISKANGILTGILADNAGWQSVASGDMSGYLKGSFAGRVASTAGGFVNSMPLKAIGGKKLSNLLQGKANPQDAKTGGALGTVIKSAGALAKFTARGVKAGAEAYKKGGGPGKGPAGGAGGGSGGAGSNKEAAIPPPQRDV
ncbi:Mbov_0396 family ICE element transmembrane protein [Pseudobutyrivibrio sp. YE44]|uniref:Mbov_0396 family ICE element transmembrane protein n=1 Tax=Pseudobutyrivibrio sp. YE44 TaxID=1520802 RepID=UPI00115FDACE|nr:hypothetical protein [Pseudobutyrivibrio sp. YE44]